jgi:UDP-GlcNAc3NAcA epimerase
MEKQAGMARVRIVTVVGTRPQFIKAATVSRAMAAHNARGGDPPVEELIVHTGQHYDAAMSKVFFDELGIPAPAVDLEVGSGPHGRQTATMLERIEEVLLRERPQWVLVYGDTNSTLAGALAAAKLHVPVAHVEAGLRSFNPRMPEEINRVVADRVSTALFCPTATAVANLAEEGIVRGVHQVGDVMYDSVLHYAAMADPERVTARLGLAPGTYYLATVHRAENTDEAGRLAGILAALGRSPRPVVLPLHPRTRKMLGAGLEHVGGPVRIIEPATYLEMLALEKHARLILTDSGGIQKEAYWFGVPCITLRDETEWVELVEGGWNRLVGADPAAIGRAIAQAESEAEVRRSPPAPSLYGDGHAAEHILAVLVRGPQALSAP